MAGKEGDYYKKGETKEGGFLKFLYNPDTKEVFGRTGLSWFKITVFYIIFYACLTAFWTIMLIVFYQTLDTIKPKWVLDRSTIGTVPGMGFRPNPPEQTVDSTLIYFKSGSQGTWKYWVDDINEYLKDYQRQEGDGEHLRNCDFTQQRDPNENKACRFAIENINNNCSASNNFGYEYGQPCILLKLNRIFDWVPEPFENNSFPSKLPKYIQDSYDPRYVYITCEGENVADEENMGPLAYYPSNGIENYYFPYRNTPGYVSPFIFVQFWHAERGVLINMECKAWAKNIHHDRQDRVGSVHFELMID
ncbi:sodium/potassium-transporting ATPase subunit beta [Ixodes scapularis]|uniref:Na+/K+ ATPase, beta subunit, putative n=3 Tax=Ixodes TaxID=6944 RepID=B7PDF7_IXOSC|nr:sodium/potassium-transporting ATPase subunit beta [Ixodes scapularis]EEC04629.1 Na+/K+ ATPase, beta subunit, putative [Ixodes scapularis]|eukprot:XP_002410791.1 Na+/K+ ATPase, beta subunit, putative [Ixodes scapularis]